MSSGFGEYEDYPHVPLGVTAGGEGPTEPDRPHHRVCWCPDARCQWTVALAEERRDGREDGLAEAWAAVLGESKLLRADLATNEHSEAARASIEKLDQGVALALAALGKRMSGVPDDARV